MFGGYIKINVNIELNYKNDTIDINVKGGRGGFIFISSVCLMGQQIIPFEARSSKRRPI